jgi:hypothetical protein
MVRQYARRARRRERAASPSVSKIHAFRAARLEHRCMRGDHSILIEQPALRPSLPEIS